MNIEYLIGIAIFILIMVMTFAVSRVFYKSIGGEKKSRHWPKVWANLVCTLIFSVGIVIIANLSNRSELGLIQSNDDYTRVFALNIVSQLHSDDDAAQSIAQNTVIADYLIHQKNTEAVNRIIDQAAQTFRLSVVYLMDRNGLTIASTNRNESDSFLGKNYSFRSYFQYAVVGTPRSIFALGVTSLRRGYYSAFPVKNAFGIVLGVLAVKRDVENMNELFTLSYPIFLISDLGEVFFSHDPRYYLSPFSAGTKNTVNDKKPVISEMGENALLFESRVYFYSKANLHVEGWTVYRLTSTLPLSINKYISLALLLFLSIAFLLGLTAVQLFKEKETLIQKRESEKALKASLERFNEMADSLPYIVFETDDRSNITYVNKQARLMTGYNLEDFPISPNILQFLHPDDFSRATKHVQMTINNETFVDHEYRLRRNDGVYIPVLIHSSPIVVAQKVTGLRGLIIDISEQKVLEEEIRKNEKLEIIGSLAGGIAHDFNNILASIQNAFSLLDLEKTNVSIQSILADLKPAIDRGRDLTTQLLTFSKGGQPIKKTIAIGPVVEQTAKFVLSGSKVNFILSIAADLKPVSVDEGQFSQVIQNIIINARDAMLNGGTISIIAMNSIHADEISISITDEGPGIPPAILPRIFDPFFTTKPQGNGLGLSICHTIIRNHQGTISVEPGREKGASFIITLPASQEDLDKTTDRPIKPSLGSGRILLMDDDPVLLKLGQALLTKLGYRVDTALNGNMALEFYARSIEQNQKYKIVILDLTIAGGMGGLQTLEKLKILDSHVNAIVTSGYSTDPVMNHFREHGFRAVVIKPYTALQLSQAIMSVENESVGGSVNER